MIIRCIDFETTGIPTETDKHAIVEIGWCDLEGEEVGQPEAVFCNPGRPIPHEAMAVHHITDDLVADAKGSLAVLGEPTYFAAHNADYERQFFETQIPVICTYKVALRLWPDASSHSLQFLRYHLGLPVRRDLAALPHRAAPDAYVCAHLMKRILSDGRASIDDMVRWSGGPGLLPRCPIGKHYGKKWEEVPTDYLEWIVFKTTDMDPTIKANAKHHLKKRMEAAA
jgi:exodeoxyribonuclease X